MELVYTSSLSIIVGIAVGLNLTKLFFDKSANTSILALKNNPIHSTSLKSNINSSLDELELRFLRSLIEITNKEIDVVDLNKLLRIEKLSKENQRQRRHIFLKELNIKLNLFLGIREVIQRIPSEIDGRVKLYSINKTVDLEYLKILTKN